MKITERFGKYFTGKSVLIMGFGTEGRSSYDFLKRHFPDVKITIYDKNPVRMQNGARFISGSISNIKDNFDIILKSPGIPLPGDFLVKYIPILSSQTDIFLREFYAQTIGVTGTKGKSTTVTLLHHILQNSGKNSILAGNIGVPVFDIVDYIDESSVVVLELSSHQLQFIQRSPHISALLNVYPEHLDFYKNFIEYRSAKMNIVKMQSEEDQIVFPVKEFRGLERNSVSVPFEIIIDGDDVIVYYWKSSIVLSKKCIELKGSHNLYNIGAALILSQLAGCNTEEAVQTVYNFKGLEHRMEMFGNYRDIEFCNDSISTIPQATAAAIRAFGNVIGTLILGGYFRNSDIVWETLVEEIKISSVGNIVFLPDTGKMIYESLMSTGFTSYESDGITVIEYNGRKIKCFFCERFDELPPIIFEQTKAHSVCLFSPASSSYNMFKNFEERGKSFKKVISDYVKGVSND